MRVFCYKCGSVKTANVIKSEFDSLKLTCDTCGRIYTLPKVSCGKKSIESYIAAIMQRLEHDTPVVVEARGVDILTALIVVGTLVIYDKVAEIIDTDTVFHIDMHDKVVPTQRIMLNKYF